MDGVGVDKFPWADGCGRGTLKRQASRGGSIDLSDTGISVEWKSNRCCRDG